MKYLSYYDVNVKKIQKTPCFTLTKVFAMTEYLIASTRNYLEGLEELYKPIGKKKRLYLFESKNSSTEKSEDLKSLYKAGGFIGIKPRSFSPKALFLDMDGTSIHEESIDFFLESLHLGEELSNITEDALQGKIIFTTSYFSRIKLLKGVHKSKLIESAKKLTLQTGIKDLSIWFHKRNLPVFIISGGLSFFCSEIATLLSAKAWHSNHPGLDGDFLTGESVGILVDTLEKKTWFQNTCENLRIPESDTVMIGDGANDRAILSAAGLPVGFRPRTILQDLIDVYNDTGDHSLLIDFLEA